MPFLHYWEKLPGQRLDFGHISLELSDGTYISFWPDIEYYRETRQGGRFSGIKGKWLNSLKEEVERELTTEQRQHVDKHQDKMLYPTATLTPLGLDENAIKEWFTEFKNGDPEWALLTRSCSNVIYKALCKGSEHFDRTQIVEGFITTPKAVFESVKDGYMKRRKSVVRLGSVVKTK